MKLLDTSLPTTALRAYVVDLATRHGVTYTKTRYDELAEVITALSDDDVELDEVQLLIIALGRAGVVPREQVLPLHANYLREKLHVRSV